MDYIIATSNLTKSYKEKVVVDKVNLHVKKGEIYGFVGPNGAGKSTIMKMLLNLVRPDSGEIYIFGEKMDDKNYECLKRIGCIIENPYFYEKMTGLQNLELHCDYMGYHNRRRIKNVLELVNLQNIEGKAVSQYSLGMKQRLAIARAILAKPELLILDEPINALDPEGIKEMRLLFGRLHQDYGTTIFISSHILSEVEQIADRIGVIAGGKLLKEISIHEVHEYQTEYIEIDTDNVKQAACLLEQDERLSHFDVVDDTVIRIYSAVVSGKEISALLVKNGVGLESIGRKKIVWRIISSSLQRRENRMVHLLKLEIRKFRLPRKIMTAFFAVAFCILFITVSLVDSMADPEQTKDTFESTFLVIGLLVSFIFLVYSSILTSTLVINEYSQRTITILFSYPLNKKLLIVIKMMLIMAFTAISLLFGYVCCCGYIVGMDYAFDMLEGSFQISYLSKWVSMAVTSTIICSILSWWPFVIGMIRKSVPATIVTSLIVLFVRQLIITKNPTNQENLFQIVLVLIVTLVAVMIVFREKVTKID